MPCPECQSPLDLAQVGAAQQSHFLSCGVTEEGEDQQLELICQSGHRMELFLHARGGRPVFNVLPSPRRREVIRLSVEEAQRLGI